MKSAPPPLPQTKNPGRTKAPAFDAVIFDIDNVLVDTRYSYLEAIRWTVEIYLTHGKVPHFVPNSKGGGPELLKLQDVERFKHLGGFNDDWDCCYGILAYILALPNKVRTIKALRTAMDFGALEKKFRTRPVGVNGITAAYGVRHVTIEKIARIFQEIYLGTELFQKTMGMRPVYWKRSGLIRRERLIFKSSVLQKLRDGGIGLGIATGRPRFEALHTLDQFGVRDFFQVITSMDDVKAAERERKCSLRKPHPFSLLETARKMGGTKKRFMYVGDLPDDVLAAKSAAKEIDIVSTAFPAMSSNPTAAMRSFREAGADFILKKPSELPRLVQTGKI